MTPQSVEFLRDFNDWRSRHGVYWNRPYAPEPVGLKEAIDWACEQIERMQWRPIETAPKDGTLIIVWAPPAHGLPGIVSSCAWHECAGFCVDELRVPTQWMPIPHQP